MAADLVVGIDIGMTGTGVAYKSNRDEEPTALTWGKDVKIPTRLFYSDHHRPPKLVGWGLEVPDDSLKPFTTREWFKVDFGNKNVDQAHIEDLYTDFLGRLYQELRDKQLTPEILGTKSFEECTIHFLFSVPATWDPALVNNFKQLISNAGYDNVKDHTAHVTMTEPQAVAAFHMCGSESSDRTKDGDNVLIIDAGGGTTDFCLLKLKDKFHGTSEVQKSSQAIEIQPVSDRYRDCKHEFGPEGFEDKTFPIPSEMIQGKSGSLSGIDPFILTDTTMASLFDAQIFQLKGEIKILLKEFESMQTNTDSGRNYVILAGGLGSSRYFKGKVQQLVSESLAELAGKTEVFTLDKPRLAVCLGLIYHAGRSPQLFPRRLHRVSLGIASQRLKDAIKQSRFRLFVKKALFHLPMDKKAEKAIEWIALKGTPVGDLGFLTFTQTTTFSPDLPRAKRIWEVAIITSSESDTERLMVEDNCRIREILKINLSQAPESFESTGPREALSRLHLARKPDVVIEVTVVVRVELATIEFQWIDSNGFRCSDPISIPTGYERLPSTGQSAVYELS
ncbi:hypothetical protein FDENT_11284 [Fusarium denticulatum]|uniref:Actin-like ATPase domain-containing protein n=1 Tax=Fusarium denticulatum TaxID=48507 RepID=A0A8H5TI17_9HYPO|nr:hypothetical protein FDENT_11284 [Fusarium denticulatum]